MTERLTGKGKVYKGQQFIADVEFELRIQSKSKETVSFTTTGSIPDFSDVHLRINPLSAISDQSGPERLTLHLSEGRKQDFFAWGECKATGGPYD